MSIHQTELSRQHISHEQVKSRLFGRPSNVRPVPVSIDHAAVNAAAIKALEAQVAHLTRKLATANAVNRTYAGIAERLKDSEQRAEKLELDLGDARARILSQAEMLKITLNGDVPGEEVEKKRSVELIVKGVLRDFPGVTWEDVKGVRRERCLVIPRHACMKAVYDERKDLSLPTLGRIFGGRDHTTILNAVRKRRPAQGE